MLSGLDAVLSERTLLIHKEYLKSLKLQLSVYEASYPFIKGKRLCELSRLLPRLPRWEREGFLSLKADALCHELYFSSFGMPYQVSQAVKRDFGSEASFLYELVSYCDARNEKFVIVYREREKIKLCGGGYNELMKLEKPLFAIDLCEHSYFLDYGFDRKGYLTNLVSYINIGKIDNFTPQKD